MEYIDAAKLEATAKSGRGNPLINAWIYYICVFKMPHLMQAICWRQKKVWLYLWILFLYVSYYCLLKSWQRSICWRQQQLLIGQPIEWQSSVEWMHIEVIWWFDLVHATDSLKRRYYGYIRQKWCDIHQWYNEMTFYKNANAGDCR